MISVSLCWDFMCVRKVNCSLSDVINAHGLGSYCHEKSRLKLAISGKSKSRQRSCRVIRNISKYIWIKIWTVILSVNGYINVSLPNGGYSDNCVKTKYGIYIANLFWFGWIEWHYTADVIGYNRILSDLRLDPSFTYRYSVTKDVVSRKMSPTYNNTPRNK